MRFFSWLGVVLVSFEMCFEDGFVHFSDCFDDLAFRMLALGCLSSEIHAHDLIKIIVRWQTSCLIYVF